MWYVDYFKLYKTSSLYLHCIQGGHRRVIYDLISMLSRSKSAGKKTILRHDSGAASNHTSLIPDYTDAVSGPVLSQVTRSTITCQSADLPLIGTFSVSSALVMMSGADVGGSNPPDQSPLARLSGPAEAGRGVMAPSAAGSDSQAVFFGPPRLFSSSLIFHNLREPILLRSTAPPQDGRNEEKNEKAAAVVFF